MVEGGGGGELGSIIEQMESVYRFSKKKISH